ncbi:hypothetical protein ACVWY3_003117 [Bradyrhizobium sp. USDA 4486]
MLITILAMVSTSIFAAHAIDALQTTHPAEESDFSKADLPRR